jgi:hypothetical protein
MLLDLIILGIYTPGYLLLALLCYRHFKNTHFQPSMYVSALFIVCTVYTAATLISLLLPVDQQYITYNLVLILAVLATDILVIFVSTIGEYKITNWAIAHIVITMVYIGYALRNFTDLDKRISNPTDMFTTDFQIYLLFTATIVMIQLRKFWKLLDNFAKKKSQIVLLLVIVFAINLVVIIISYALQMFNLSGSSINGTLILFGYLYIAKPDFVFFAPSRIYQVNLIHGRSGLPIIALNQKENILTSTPLFASFLLQMEVSGAKFFPVELNFGDKHILIEQRQIGSEIIMGFATASASLKYFRESLKFALELFEKQCGVHFCEDYEVVSNFDGFHDSLKKIFAYAYIEEDKGSVK